MNVGLSVGWFERERVVVFIVSECELFTAR